MACTRAFFVVATAILSCSYAQESETITGTIFCDNDFMFYINGELVAEDPVDIIPHNALNVTFTIPRGEPVVFAITAIDWANETTGLEYDNRCVGDGGVRAMFSNGVVTNSSWKCWTSLYGPVNWQACYAADDRDNTLKVLPACKQETTPPLEGCYTRTQEIPADWNTLDFDDSNWEFALEWDDDYVGWGLPPTGCDNSSVYISPDTDPSGNPLTCPRQLNWGASKFIWRDDLDLDNAIHCRYIYNEELDDDNGAIPIAASKLGIITVLLALTCIFIAPQ